MWAGDQAAIVAAIEAFVTGASPARRSDRRLATVMFTDIVASTARAAAVGDRSWRELLARHDALVRSCVERAAGHVIKSTGDGILATFDGPGRAIDACREILDAASDLDLHVRVGLHAGEIEVSGDDIAGLAVHVAARVSGLAAADEVLAWPAAGRLDHSYDHLVLYQPGHRKFEVEDPAALLEELCRHVPATLVTHTAAGFRASILPMLFDPEDGPFGTLRGHLARGNPQWREVGDDTDGLAILDGPDAYVSPTWYAEKRVTGKVVPTWNYITVQAQGNLRIRDEPGWLLAHVRRLVDRHEQPRPDPWSIDDAPDGYIETQARAIVGLELRIDRLEAKRKLSQNRNEADIAGTIAGLRSGGPREQAVAASMTDQETG